MSKVHSLTKKFQSSLLHLRNELKEEIIVSLAFEIQNKHYQFNSILKRSNFCFYYEKPSKEYSIFAEGEILSFIDEGSGRFNNLDKKYRKLKKSIITNWDHYKDIEFPLFVGGMKFHPDLTSDIWKDFPSSKWVIPQIALIKYARRVFIMYNFIYHKNEDAVSNFKAYTDNFFNHADAENKERALNKFQSIRTLHEKKEWGKKVRTALSQIKENKIKKIVLSRKAEFCVANMNFYTVFSILRNKFPDCTLFLYKNLNSYFYGATPENLALFSNGLLYVDALAGSAPRGKNKEKDLKFRNKLLGSKKNLEEHQFVSFYILSILKKYSDKITILREKDIKILNNIQHIWSEFAAGLKKNYSIFKILNDLFPTPAVCGLPKENAYNLIIRIEDYDRGLYSGITGWFNHNNNGEFIISLRSALYFQNRLFAFAGCGIVEDSEPDEEFRETELKLRPILSVFFKNED